MLKMALPADDKHEAITVKLEHSLISLYNWEAKHKKPFYSKEPNQAEEMLSYIQYMVLNDYLPDDWMERLTEENFQTITSYINDTQTATTFHESSPSRNTEVITAEVIYHWMISFKIPFYPCETWHLNRLMTLVRVSGIKQTKPKRMTKSEQAEQYARLNAERRARLNTAG